jgi:Cytochrome P450
MEALSPAQLRVWRAQLTPEVQALAGNLPIEEPLDLMDRYARPLCLSLAVMVTDISRYDAEVLCELSCWPSGAPELWVRGALANYALPAENAWFALIQHPQAWRLLHQHRGLTEQAIQELLRYVGIVRTLYRTATADTDLNGYFIRKGERVILRIIGANHDPHRFSCPIQLDVTRRDGAILPLEPGRTRV